MAGTAFEISVYSELQLIYAMAQSYKMINITLPYTLSILNAINRKCNCRKARVGHQKYHVLFQTLVQISKHGKIDIIHISRFHNDTSTWSPYLKEQDVKERDQIVNHEYFTFPFTRLTSREIEGGKKTQSFNEFLERLRICTTYSKNDQKQPRLHEIIRIYKHTNKIINTNIIRI